MCLCVQGSVLLVGCFFLLASVSALPMHKLQCEVPARYAGSLGCRCICKVSVCPRTGLPVTAVLTCRRIACDMLWSALLPVEHSIFGDYWGDIHCDCLFRASRSCVISEPFGLSCIIRSIEDLCFDVFVLLYSQMCLCFVFVSFSRAFINFLIVSETEL